MHYFTRTNAFRVALVLLCTQMYSVYGQEQQTYSGPYQLGTYKGEANFSYFLDTQDTILQGNFKMQRSSLDALLGKEDNSFLFSGAFENDYPTGTWKFEFGEFQSDKQTQVVDYQYRVLVSGVQEEAKGRIVKGKPDGPWTYMVNKIADSEIEETLFKSSMLFNKGIPQQSFEIENTGNTLVGRFLRDGLAHDEWSLFSSEEIGTSESWIFKEGVLQRIRIEKEGEWTDIRFAGNDTNTTKTVNLDAAYLKTLHFLQTNTETVDLAKSAMEPMLAENTNYYKKLDTILSQLGKASFLPEFKVNVPYYPLDSLENRQLEQVSEQFKIATEISDFFLNSSQLGILKLSDAEANRLYGAVKALSETYLEPLGDLIRLKEEGIYEYAARQQIFLRLFPEVPSKELIINPTDGVAPAEPFVLPNADAYDFNGTSLNTVQQISSYALESLKTVEPLLSKKLSINKQELELRLLEEQLIAENQTLQHLLDTVLPSLPNMHVAALEHIKTVTDAKLGAFSTAEDVESARELLECYQATNKLANTIAQLPSKSMEIREKYTDRIWNPFMANLMDEEVKKRITSAYRKILIPYYLEMVQEKVDCITISALDELIGATTAKILDLRDQDTHKLERKLKRAKDPLAVLKLLDVPTLVNDNQ